MSTATSTADTNPELPFADWMRSVQTRMETTLSHLLPADEAIPARLHQAMRYASLGGGKRVRPLLTFAAGELTGAKTESLEIAASAVELIHAYSLVHDDMPCMDNDVLRRGKPTVHVQYGEALALLAGDALQALAFELLTPDEALFSAAVQARLCRLLARAAGHEGMAGGQAIDLASVGQALTENQLRQMHRLKTGALLRGSVMMGAACREPAGTAHAATEQALSRFGDAIGLAFQVVDDILDVTTDTAILGKTAGKDAAADKPTYVSVLGLERSRDYVQELYAQALAALDASGLDAPSTRALRALAGVVVHRDK